MQITSEILNNIVLGTEGCAKATKKQCQSANIVNFVLTKIGLLFQPLRW